MIPDKDYVYEGLLRCNYFPMVKKYLDELPPVFSTKDFIPSRAYEICKGRSSRKQGYDQIEYRSTRFNNVTRQMHIPHPLPYAKLCKCISDNWDKLNRICENPVSQIKPKQHNDDRLVIIGEYEELVAGRVIVMDHEVFPESVISEMEMASAARYRVKADISSCFPSIYTHSIPWALVGHEYAKSNRQSTEWFNELDKYQRYLKRGETHGIPIGPATSNIISEIILLKIDEELANFTYIRFIDDYKCYCTTQKQAEVFLISLERELRKYLLNINVKKILIEELPLAHRADWVIDLANHLPPQKYPSVRRITDFLDYAINLQKLHPEGSVLKYAARSLVKKVDEKSAEVFINYLRTIAFHYPVIIPIFCEAVKKYAGVVKDWDFTPILKQHLRFSRSDAVCWTVYLMGTCGQKISDDLANEIIKSKDCMSMAMLVSLNQHKDKVVKFIKDSCNSEYDRDRYWLLIHELMIGESSFDKYREETGLKCLADNNIHFISELEPVVS